MALDNSTDYDDLQELSDSDFEIADGQPDIFGWDVIDTHKNKVGEVYELMFNPNTRKVRYIVVDMESNDVDLEEGRVLVPIEVADFDLDNDNVKLPGVSVTNLLSLPLYEKGRVIDHETDEEIRIALAKAEKDAPIPPGSLNVSQTKFYGKHKNG
ncbi:PRC-barrel domain containing protein [Mucilaginibacter sp. 14171R-50]|uniref:PRC-barrel domain-containing protein n=1 Tax=Mucilaginibacter sp. 14171R-50 TaxID=2703789 RepID=UPI00138D765A|nr:PRC-barrel domain-containing protein [Mucilaginibacter sp. 14171R-50]QHS56892.1 PRC-barrel domain containing protein [Mucilaginibacter sp. 14171R-50]